MRIASLLPSATEIAFSLGLGDAVVGVSHECDYPAIVQDCPVLTRSAVATAGRSSRESDDTFTALLRDGGSTYTFDDVVRDAALLDEVPAWRSLAAVLADPFGAAPSGTVRLDRFAEARA